MNTIDHDEGSNTKLIAWKAKKDRPNEWASLKTIDNSSVDIRGNYVLRPRLSWTGLYGKAPWPRERKQWEKV
jgi:hypothetical protein